MERLSGHRRGLDPPGHRPLHRPGFRRRPQAVTITATAPDNSGRAATATVTLIPVIDAGFRVTPSTDTLYPGETRQFGTLPARAVVGSVNGRRRRRTRG
ncbi:MAG: hypothetical protein KY468_07255 [Armatimonadetes bacterium]|nr:hypothetical protein [Armatimonadota bacterium]